MRNTIDDDIRQLAPLLALAISTAVFAVVVWWVF
jgi:hypothetical protein